METLKTIAIYTGGTIVAIVAFHIFILTFMVLAIMVSPEQVIHTPYWDRWLRAVIELLH